MGALDSKERLKELYLPSAKDFVLVDVPKLQFIMVDGKGSPQGQHFSQMIRWLFAVVHPIKLIAKERMGRNFVEPPLECLYWSDDMRDFIAGKKARLKWRLMIVATANWLTNEMFEQAVETASKKLGKAPASLRLDTYVEGKSVQIMHVGPPSSISATMARLHNEFLPAHKLVANGHHHEIYLNDPRRVAPGNLRTVLRQPVRKRSPARRRRAPAKG
jgi:hypothetical protein